MDHLHRISRDMKITILMNLHQVDMAIKYSDRIIGMRGGSIVYDGEAKKAQEEDGGGDLRLRNGRHTLRRVSRMSLALKVCGAND